MTARIFKQEDLPQVIELYDHTSGEDPHFVRDEASVKYLLTCISSNKGSTFVTEANGELTGFAIVSVGMEQAGLKQGNIVELRARDATSMRALVQAALEHCNQNEVDSVIVVPPDLPETNEVFKDWLKFDTGVMMAKALSPAPLLKALLSRERTRSLYAGKKITFHIGEDVVNIEITATEVNVLQTGEKQDKAFAHVFMSPDVFLRLVLGQLNPYTSYLNRKVKVKGAKNTLSLLRLLYLMRVEAHFFTSLADRM